MASAKHLGNDLVIRHANHVVDIFWGNTGWNPHARFRIKNTPKGKFLSQINGDRVPTTIFKQVISQVGV